MTLYTRLDTQPEATQNNLSWSWKHELIAYHAPHALVLAAICQLALQPLQQTLTLHII